MKQLKAAARQLLQTFAPASFDTIQAIRTRRLAFHCSAVQGNTKVDRKFVDRYGYEVRRGPFAGMRLPADRALWIGTTYMLTGSLEAELHPAIERLVARGVDTAVNIGCAEGYYAVGVAVRVPTAKSIAYDIDPAARAYCRALAEASGVGDRVDVRRRCDHGELAKVVGPRTLVICDCEGCEFEILRPDRVPQLAAADLIVELHEDGREAAVERFLASFAPTHDLELVTAARRDLADYPELSFLSGEEARLAVDEVRMTQQRWAVLSSKSR